jgi:hypothetical protein
VVVCKVLRATVSRVRAMIGKQAPPVWLRCCSLKSPSFWLSSNTNFCVIFLDMNGVALKESFVYF